MEKQLSLIYEELFFYSSGYPKFKRIKRLHYGFMIYIYVKWGLQTGGLYLELELVRGGSGTLWATPSSYKANLNLRHIST